MPGSSFQNGIDVRGIPILGTSILTTGQVYFVHSPTGKNQNGRGLTKEQPLLSIEWTMDKIGAGDGDVIIVMPGHVETVSAAGGLTIDKAGVRIVGIGQGGAKPQINVGTVVGASVLVSADDVYLENLQINGAVDALTQPLNITGDDCQIVNLLTTDVTGQATDFILATAAVDLQIKGWTHRGASAAGANSAIALDGCTRFRLEDFWIDGNFAVGAIDFRTTLSADVTVHKGFARTRNAADVILVDTITGSTGFIGPDISARLQDNAANITEAFTGATFVYFQPINLVNLAGESSMQSNITASTDA